jgi:BTB/POZ domain
MSWFHAAASMASNNCCSSSVEIKFLITLIPSTRCTRATTSWSPRRRSSVVRAITNKNLRERKERIDQISSRNLYVSCVRTDNQHKEESSSFMDELHHRTPTKRTMGEPIKEEIGYVESIYGTGQFKAHLASLINDPTFCDITLIVKGDGDIEYKYFAHRAILASWSDVFKQVYSPIPIFA